MTDEQGRPIPRPCREDFESSLDYLRAFHAFNDQVAHVANVAFTEQLRLSLKRPSDNPIKALFTVLSRYGVSVVPVKKVDPEDCSPFCHLLGITDGKVVFRASAEVDMDLCCAIIHEAGHLVHGFEVDEGTWHWWELQVATEVGLDPVAWAKAQGGYSVHFEGEGWEANLMPLDVLKRYLHHLRKLSVAARVLRVPGAGVE